MVCTHILPPYGRAPFVRAGTYCSTPELSALCTQVIQPDECTVSELSKRDPSKSCIIKAYQRGKNCIYTSVDLKNQYKVKL